MHFYQTNAIALFIDGANLYATAKSLGFDIDYKRLLTHFRAEGPARPRALLHRAWPRTRSIPPSGPLIDWLDYNGFTMVTKPTKEFTDASGRRKMKGNMDIELRWMPCASPSRSITSCSSPATAISAASSPPCSRWASVSASSQRCRHSRRWLPMSCAGRRTSSSISPTSSSSSAAIRQRVAVREGTRSPAGAARTSSAARAGAFQDNDDLSEEV